jgi:hypothetical protein
MREMFAAFFTLAAQSPSRQAGFRRLVIAHVLFLLGVVWLVVGGRPGSTQPRLGHLLLVAGIVEGAVLVGWRLSQMPKSQALEFLLVSPVRPGGLFLSEAAVGLTLLGLVTLSGLPILSLLLVTGYLGPLDVLILLVWPWTWGAITGLGLTVWAYEPLHIRRWGERAILLLILIYLVVGVLAAEKLKAWLDALPDWASAPILFGLYRSLLYNPFAMLHLWMIADLPAVWETVLIFELISLGVVGLLLWRGAVRILGHFHELHYTPRFTDETERRPAVGDSPLSWWAVRRVTRFGGRINVYLAGGFCLLYAAYILAGPYWPTWLGTAIFGMCDASGGVPMLTTMLVLLAAVPAAFQYGLWDSSTSDRLRRLELLLLTELRPIDYWNAAVAAAWSRGRGYLYVAMILGASAWAGERISLAGLLGAASVAVLLWTLYFALGFRAFSRGREANGLGMLLTVGLPLGTVVLYQVGWAGVAQVLPPGSLFGASRVQPDGAWLLGAIVAAAATLIATRLALATCDERLRRWYDQNTGSDVVG